MLTLSYGFLKPQSGDKGSVFFPALEADIQQLNDHTHNGLNSSKLTTGSTVATAQNVSAAGWVSSGNRYRQLVTLTGGLQYDEVAIEVRDQITKKPMLLSIERQSATTFYVYTIDNTLTLTIIYTS